MADFHAADLWVAVVPDVSKVGPAMEQAGKDAKGKFGAGVKDIGKTIHDDLDKAATKVKDSFSKIGKDISDGFGKVGKDAGDKLAKGVDDETKGTFGKLGDSLGGELGTALGKKLGEALADNIPEIGQLRDAFGTMRDAVKDLESGDLGGALKGWNDTLDTIEPLAKDIGIDISGWKVPPDVVKDVGDISIAGLAAKEAFIGLRTALIALAGPEVVAALGLLALDMAPIIAAAAGITAIVEGIKAITGSASTLDTSLSKLQLQNQGPTPPGGFPAPPTVPKPQPLPQVPGFAPYDIGGGQYGGPIDGPGAIGKDSVLMFGAPGEHMLTADEVAGAGGHQNVYAWRAMMKAGYFKNIPGFDDGGGIGTAGAGGSGNMANLYRYAASMVGTPYSMGARNDCSGMASRLINVALGLPPVASFSTANEQSWLTAHGFIMGPGPPGTLRVGWHMGGPGGGHTAVTLPDGTPAEAGGSHGSFLLGGGAAGAESPQFEMHAYLPMNPEGTSMTSAGSPGGATGGAIGSAGGGGGGAQTSNAQLGQQLGGAMASGAMEALGLDGSVFKSFTGKGPMDWGITKLGTGILNWGMPYLKALMPGGGPGMPGGMGGGILQGLAGAVGVNVPGGGGAAAGGDTHNHYAPQNQINVNQQGVDDGPQAWQGYQNSSDYAGQMASMPGN